MTEQHAWQRGKEHVDRMRRDAVVAGLARHPGPLAPPAGRLGGQAGTGAAGGAALRALAAAARALAGGLVRIADAIERRQRPHLT